MPTDPYFRQRGPIKTEFVNPPIPYRGNDWSAHRPDSYDGAEDAHPTARLMGWGETEEEAIASLLEAESEYFDPDEQRINPSCGASQVACEVINQTFLSLDGFEPLRRRMNMDKDYPALAFAANLARIVDRVLREQNQLPKQG